MPLRVQRVIIRYVLVACVLWCIPGTLIRAEDSPVDFDYDIFLVQDTMMVWLDVTPVLNQALFEDLLAGLQIQIDIKYKAEYPPNPIFAETIRERQRTVYLRRDVTGDFYELIEVNGLQDTVLFSSQLDMSDYLTDSLEIRLLPVSVIRDGAKLRLKMEIDTKSLPYKKLVGNVRSRSEAGDDNTAPAGQALNSVFSYFLEFIGFGEQKYQITTPTFKISSLESYPRQD